MPVTISIFVSDVVKPELDRYDKVTKAGQTTEEEFKVVGATRELAVAKAKQILAIV